MSQNIYYMNKWGIYKKRRILVKGSNTSKSMEEGTAYTQKA
jgi:hypothetical protein